jgi:RNA polymerase sporulation-specific sigma factor
VKSKSRALFLVGGDREDLIQEGMIGLFKAIRDFDAANGAPFAAFAKLCVERQIYTAIEAAGRMKNAPLNAYISLSEESETLMDGGIEDAVIEKTSFQQMYLDAQAHLSRMEKEVLSFFLEGKEYTEIAEILGKTDKSIDNAVEENSGTLLRRRND